MSSPTSTSQPNQDRNIQLWCDSVQRIRNLHALARATPDPSWTAFRPQDAPTVQQQEEICRHHCTGTTIRAGDPALCNCLIASTSEGVQVGEHTHGFCSNKIPYMTYMDALVIRINGHGAHVLSVARELPRVPTEFHFQIDPPLTPGEKDSLNDLSEQWRHMLQFYLPRDTRKITFRLCCCVMPTSESFRSSYHPIHNGNLRRWVQEIALTAQRLTANEVEFDIANIALNCPNRELHASIVDELSSLPNHLHLKERYRQAKIEQKSRTGLGGSLRGIFGRHRELIRISVRGGEYSMAQSKRLTKSILRTAGSIRAFPLESRQSTGKVSQSDVQAGIKSPSADCPVMSGHIDTMKSQKNGRSPQIEEMPRDTPLSAHALLSNNIDKDHRSYSERGEADVVELETHHHPRNGVELSESGPRSPARPVPGAFEASSHDSVPLEANAGATTAETVKGSHRDCLNDDSAPRPAQAHDNFAWTGVFSGASRHPPSVQLAQRPFGFKSHEQTEPSPQTQEDDKTTRTNAELHDAPVQMPEPLQIPSNSQRKSPQSEHVTRRTEETPNHRVNSSASGVRQSGPSNRPDASQSTSRAKPADDVLETSLLTLRTLPHPPEILSWFAAHHISLTGGIPLGPQLGPYGRLMTPKELVEVAYKEAYTSEVLNDRLPSNAEALVVSPASAICEASLPQLPPNTDIASTSGQASQPYQASTPTPFVQAEGLSASIQASELGLLSSYLAQTVYLDGVSTPIEQSRSTAAPTSAQASLASHTQTPVQSLPSTERPPSARQSLIEDTAIPEDLVTGRSETSLADAKVLGPQDENTPMTAASKMGLE